MPQSRNGVILEKQIMFKRKEISFRRTSLQHIYTVIFMKVICNLTEVNQSHKFQCLNFRILKIHYQPKIGSQASQILFATWEKFRDKRQRDKRPLKVKSIHNSSALKSDIGQPAPLLFFLQSWREKKRCKKLNLQIQNNPKMKT